MYFFEFSIDVILFISSVVSLIVSFILYKWFLKKYLLSEFNKSRKNVYLVFFIYSIVISAISVLCSAVEIDILNVLSACLQQSYYLVSEFFGESENCTLITCIVFIIENMIKMIILLPKNQNRKHEIQNTDDSCLNWQNDKMRGE